MLVIITYLIPQAVLAFEATKTTFTNNITTENSIGECIGPKIANPNTNNWENGGIRWNTSWANWCEVKEGKLTEGNLNLIIGILTILKLKEKKKRWEGICNCYYFRFFQFFF